MFEIYSFCRAVDDIADDQGPAEDRLKQLDRWRDDIDAIYRGEKRPGLAGLAIAVRDFQLEKDDFRAIIDGMETDVRQNIQAPEFVDLDLYCDRVASAVGRLSVRVFRMPREEGRQLAEHLGRALQLTNILRDLDEDAAIGRLYLPREFLNEAGIESADPATVLASPELPQVCERIVSLARWHFAEADKIMKAHPRKMVRTPRVMSEAYKAILGGAGRARLCAAKGARQAQQVAHRHDRASQFHSLAMDRLSAEQTRSHSRGKRGAGLTHIVGAGVAGLSAAVRLAEKGRAVAVYEAAGHAGGRCRSYYDAGLGAVIDNGNHLLLSGNDAALSYLKLIGGSDKLKGPAKAEFDFADLKTGERWALKINDGRWPSWLFDASRRVPATKPLDYLEAAPLMWAGAKKTVTDIISSSGALYDRLWQPLMLAALNTDPQEGSARLAGAVMRNTLAKGGAACRPLVAEGLSAAFIDPALAYLHARGKAVAFGRRLREIAFDRRASAP